MEKFYDNIDIPTLVREGSALQYPAIIMALGMQMHLAAMYAAAHVTSGAFHACWSE